MCSHLTHSTNQAKRAAVRQLALAGLTCSLLAGIASAAGDSTARTSPRVEVEVSGPQRSGEPGRAPGAQVFWDAPGSTGARLLHHWKDGHGRRLTEPMPLPRGRPERVAAPRGSPGYYGLVLTPAGATDDAAIEAAFADHLPGESREFGFAVIPERRSTAQRFGSQLGVVHADVEDPHLPVWVKTLTWLTTGADWWPAELERRAQHGKLELPIVTGGAWRSDDTRAIEAGPLARLAEAVQPYFAASPPNGWWEAGIEENLRANYREPFYWSNLAAKLRVLRTAGQSAGNPQKLVYQVATIEPEAVRRFAASEAAPLVDVLSIHPYAWPDFPPPEAWLVPMLKGMREVLHEAQLDLPVWFTEVGVPHHGNHAEGFFGYPATGAEVLGKNGPALASYLVRLHAIALHGGVEKVFWYNYRDRDRGRDYAENHFGLLDVDGFPKPAYVAYATLVRLLEGFERVSLRTPREGVRVYSFHTATHTTHLAWTYPPKPLSLPVAALVGRPTGTVEGVDLYGRMTTLDATADIPLDGNPHYFVTGPR